MVKFFEGFNFLKLETLVPRVIFLLELFNGDNLVLRCDGFEDDPKTTVTHRFDDLIFLHQRCLKSKLMPEKNV